MLTEYLTRGETHDTFAPIQASSGLKNVRRSHHINPHSLNRLPDHRIDTSNSGAVHNHVGPMHRSLHTLKVQYIPLNYSQVRVIAEKLILKRITPQVVIYNNLAAFD
jgi:hypothetical protein